MSMRKRSLEHVVEESGCWRCTSHKNNKRGQVQSNVARRYYKMHKGEIPLDLIVIHTCSNDTCVNPEHLTVGDLYDKWNIINKVDLKKYEILPAIQWDRLNALVSKM